MLSTAYRRFFNRKRKCRLPDLGDKEGVDFTHSVNRQLFTALEQITVTSICKRSVQLSLLLGVLAVAIIISFPSPIKPVSFRMPNAPKLTGALSPNTRLRSAQQLLKSRIVGPESIAVGADGVFYTGLANGKVISVKGKVITEIGHTGHPSCNSEETCGRPLGLRIHNDSLYVINSYKGIIKIELDGSGQQVVLNMKDQSIRLGNIQTKFINDLDISRAGNIYFTDSSSRHSRQYNAYAFIEGVPHGSLFSFDLATFEIELLVSGLHFANGVQLSPDESFLLIAECSRARIIRYWLTGDQAGTYDYFIHNLPGYPDNIRPRENGGYWVGLAAIRRDPFSFFDSIAHYPQFRAIICKIIPYFLLKSFASQYGIIVALDEYGYVMDSLQDPGGEVITSVSEIAEYDGVLYLGSYYANFVGQLKLRDEF